MILSNTNLIQEAFCFRLLILILTLISLLTLYGCSDDETTPKTQALFTFKIIESDPSEITFINASTNADSYIWDFGDGVTSTEFSPTHRFKTNGAYNVSLNAIANNDQSKVNQIVTVTCPYGPDMFTGTYTYHPIDNSSAFGVPPFGCQPYNTEVSYLSPFTRSVSLHYIQGNFHTPPAMDFIFDINCSVIVPHDSMKTNIGCGEEILIGAPDPEFYSSIDSTNDSLINITFEDLQYDGECGVPPQNLRFKLVKN